MILAPLRPQDSLDQALVGLDQPDHFPGNADELCGLLSAADELSGFGLLTISKFGDQFGLAHEDRRRRDLVTKISTNSV